jgi:hypothetical protein
VPRGLHPPTHLRCILSGGCAPWVVLLRRTLCRACTSRRTACSSSALTSCGLGGHPTGLRPPPLGAAAQAGKRLWRLPGYGVSHLDQVGAKALPFRPTCPPALHAGCRASPPTVFARPGLLCSPGLSVKNRRLPHQAAAWTGACAPNFRLHGRPELRSNLSTVAQKSAPGLRPAPASVFDLGPSGLPAAKRLVLVLLKSPSRRPQNCKLFLNKKTIYSFSIQTYIFTFTL